MTQKEKHSNLLMFLQFDNWDTKLLPIDKRNCYYYYYSILLLFNFIIIQFYYYSILLSIIIIIKFLMINELAL